ncbi:MAG: DUF3343 domain-containing protein [Clostridia bacterium]|jgi:hypothetical protein|nr:DUF3343 domain-containing protein [Clostridia bacterium]
MEEKFYVIAFETTHYAIMAEKKLIEKYRVQMIPTPRVISASCGLSLKVGEPIIKDVINEMRTWDIDDHLLDVYRIEKIKGRDLSTRVDWLN